MYSDLWDRRSYFVVCWCRPFLAGLSYNRKSAPHKLDILRVWDLLRVA